MSVMFRTLNFSENANSMIVVGLCQNNIVVSRARFEPATSGDITANSPFLC